MARHRWKRAASLAFAVASLALASIVLYHWLTLSFTLRIVMTDSMEPSVPRYSLVLERKGYTGDVMVGDIVFYKYPGGKDVFMHRVVNATLNDIYIVKGDNVEYSEEIPPSQIVGVYAGGIYIAGSTVVNIITDPGAMLAVALLLTGLSSLLYVAERRE